MKSILIIEDNEDNMELTRQILEDEGYRVVGTALAEEGIAKLKSESIELVLMDISLPVMDGLEATRRIRDDPQLAGLPIIALTAHATISDHEQAIEAGCSDYISKPFDELRLLQSIRKWIG